MLELLFVLAAVASIAWPFVLLYAGVWRAMRVLGDRTEGGE